MALVKVYSGSEIEVAPVKAVLEEADINPVVKNNVQSATLAGFGSFGQAMELYVEAYEADKAKTLITNYTK
ncbi:putative signal transducing protein [Flavobacterium beibuense]|uniref:putative signal transducing protein n=1 Tax=Flavobacterium beibuense TaxID=657326 RepID=UPI003A8D191E